MNTPDHHSPSHRPPPAAPPLTTDATQWTLPDDVTYLNHGSFGPSPRVVQEVRQAWSQRLERQPMDFFIRQMEEHLDAADERLGAFVGADASDLLFVDNATVGMNIVAQNVALGPGDQVLLSDQEYGAVLRIWQRACRKAGAQVVVANLPLPLTSASELVDALFAHVTQRTRLIVVSHVTSPTAVIFPVAEICRRARAANVPVCIDGPHAIAMAPLDLAKLGCDFYTASCHKWLCAPFGTGFLYVAKQRQQGLQPVTMSWGRSIAGRPAHWRDEFTWMGTRDPAGFLAIPAAIDFLESAGLDAFRQQTHALAQYALRQITSFTGLQPLLPDDPAWYGSMIALPLPTDNWQPPPQDRRDPLQDALWQRRRIEVPIISWNDRRFVRVSCHLYNQPADVDRLTEALRELL